jgi:hypothetical protein
MVGVQKIIDERFVSSKQLFFALNAIYTVGFILPFLIY